MLGFALLTGVFGARAGFLGTALSAVGVSWERWSAPVSRRICSPTGRSSPAAPLVALLGAGALAALFEAVAIGIGGRLRALRPSPQRRSVAGFVLGIAIGFVLVWVFGAVALQFPGQTRLRREAQQRSEVLQRLNETAPPSRALRRSREWIPFPTIVGPLAR